MADDGANLILQRIAERGAATGPSVMSPVRALRLAVPKAAEQELRMPVTASEISETQLGHGELGDLIPEHALLAHLTASDGAKGLVVIDPQLLAGIIEMQTTGRVIAAKAVARPPTRTDVTMSESFVNQIFGLLEEILGANQRGPWFYGYRMGQRIDGPRKLGIVLEEGAFIVCQITLDLCFGAKEGGLILAVPAGVRTAGRDGAVTADQEDWRAALQSTVLGSEVRLEAVLHRVSMPLSEVVQLKEGQVLTIPRQALSAVRLEGGAREKAGCARLGQAQGFRAVRLVEEAAAGQGQSLQGRAVPAGGPHSGSAMGRPGATGRPDIPDAALQSEFGTGVELAASDYDNPQGSDTSGLSALPAAGEPMADLPELPDLPPLPVAAMPEPDVMMDLADLPMAPLAVNPLDQDAS